MSPRAWLFLAGLFIGIALLAWDEWRTERYDRGVLPFIRRVRATYHHLRGRA